MYSQGAWNDYLVKLSASLPLQVPSPKVFKPKMNLPILQNYSGYVSDMKYWEYWPKNIQTVGKSKIDGQRLKELALESNFKDLSTLDKVFKDLTEGARIGCVGKYRYPSVSNNAKMAYDFGERVSDAVAEWVKDGYARGPVNKEDVPREAKISGIMTKAKPNGSVKVILNLSAPLGKSVNEGIDNACFPATMSSTKKWLQILHPAGKGCLIVKINWSSAYKQVAVQLDDLHLQWFQWLGKFFCELSLIFGAISSVGIFYRLAKVVLHVVLFRSRFPSQLVSQHLDDCCAAAPAKDMAIYNFDNEYKAVANELNILLAPRDDPEKSFAPTTQGCVYGGNYDTEQESWWLSEDKVARIQLQVRELLEVQEMEQQKFWSLTGKILHIKDLIVGGKFHLYHILKANSVHKERKDSHKMVTVSEELKREMWWWYTMVTLSSKRSKYPDPDECLPAWSLIGYTDAAGGTTLTPGSGCGAVLEEWWTYVPWSPVINGEGRMETGKRIGRKLTALELVGPLALVCGAPDKVRGKPVRIMVDNAGSVAIWQKGYSTSCVLSSVLVRAIYEVSVAMECTVDIVKITRCSNKGSEMADALSK